MDRTVMFLGILAGAATLPATLLIGCGGDNSQMDGGPDGAMDSTQAETGSDAGSDVGDATNNEADVVTNAVAAFQLAAANDYCTRLQTCCAATDAGAFDYSSCLAVGLRGWEGSNNDLRQPGVLDGGRVTLNQGAATSCLADLTTFTCANMASSEYKTLTGNCMAAVSGTSSAGGPCLVDTECQTTEYCNVNLLQDGGPGTCATLLTQGTLCGQGTPWYVFNVTYRSDQCSYKAGPTPALFCDYDSDPDASGFTCQPLRSNNAGCFYDNECASGICGVDDGTCDTTYNSTDQCQYFVSPADAGSD